MSQRRPHKSDLDLAKSILLPTTIFKRHQYKLVQDSSDRFIKRRLKDLWHIESTRIYLATSRGDSSIFLIETTDGIDYEYYTYPPTHDLSSAVHLVRRVYQDGSRGAWKQPREREWHEAAEKSRRENT